MITESYNGYLISTDGNTYIVKDSNGVMLGGFSRRSDAVDYIRSLQARA